MKDLCVIYSGLIQMIVVDGELVRGELDIRLDRISQRRSIIITV
jgi:hypothetical protein